MQASLSDTELVQANLSLLHDEVFYESHLSFAYFLDFVKSMGEHYPLYDPFFSHVIEKFEAVPGLRGRVTDASVLQQHPELLQLLEAALFPPAGIEPEAMFAFSTPWYFRPFHASKKLHELLSRNLLLSDEEALRQFRREKAELLFAQILRRHYGLDIEVHEHNTYPALEQETQLTKYYQVHYDLRFRDVIAKGPLPAIDREYIEENFSTLCETMELASLLSPEHFALEGFTVIRVFEVTESAAVTELKNAMLRMLDDGAPDCFSAVEKTLHSLVGVPGASVSLLPFPKINNHLCWWGETEWNHLLGAIIQNDATGKVFQEVEAYFARHPGTLLFSSFPSKGVPSFLRELKATDVKSYLLAPLLRGRELIGVLQVAAYKANALQEKHLHQLRPAQVLLIQMLSNYLQQRSDTVEQLIKDKFTSLHTAVEWKFREVAYQYLKARLSNPAAEVGPLRFEQVYPAYGAVDIRGSSVKRSEAIQKDLVEHLNLIVALTGELRLQEDLPILQETAFKATQFLDLIGKGLNVENEAYISSFLESEVSECLDFLMQSFPGMRAPIQDYRRKTEKETGVCCQHRRRYEQSVEAINRVLAQYRKKEEARLQGFYPHLYEKYRSDGVEYNLYFGQSIQPDRAFHPLHRKNIYLWQLATMVDMARLTRQLEPTLPVLLQTTQLILLYGSPINISFRRDERKFDVDDAYNIRYELLKKRIDKVCIKGTQERLTQPGKIAIIYSRYKDAELLMKYIDYLAGAGRLLPTVEQLELEDTQGVTGLRALRVQVREERET